MTVINWENKTHKKSSLHGLKLLNNICTQRPLIYIWKLINLLQFVLIEIKLQYI